MAQSQNTVVELTTPGTSFMGLSKYGNVMIGDKAFEFYNGRNVEDYIQIPWSDIDRVAASVMFRGKVIPRFVIMTKSNGNYSFSTKNNKQTLRAMRGHVPEDRLVRSPNFLDVVSAGIRSLFHRH